ncbi:hypothetical protein ONZ45_g7382 [Pleurotus djamor]|nr:hypothetical protein ONZ45_g7382 [Pleurotus djamor]
MGDWRPVLSLPADRIRRRDEWLRTHQGLPVNAVHHQYIVAFEDDNDPEDDSEWFDPAYFEPKKTTTTTRFLHRSVEASPQTSLASRNLAFTSRPPSEPDPTALIPQLADDVPESANTFGELDVAAEEPNDEENDNVVDPALVRRQRVPLLITWLPKRDTYVDEFLRLEGREGLDDCCSCIVSEHSTAPFHEISQWNGDFFERVSLMSLGLSIQLGHPLGEACPSPIPAFNGTFKILTFTGIVETNLNFCNCLQASTRYQQLLRARLFPATHQEPRTAATFEVLRHFQLLSFNSKVSAYEYYQTLVRLTDNVGNPIPLHTTYLVPKFHLFAHRTACHIEYSFNLTPRVGRTDGESPERGWAAMNPIASSTKEMGPGSRRDTLDDHFGDYNWRKVISLHSTLLTRFEEAIEMKTAHIAAFLDFSASLSNSSVQQFSHAVWKWEQDYSQDNPFEAKVPEITQAKIRRQLADEDAAAIAQDSHIAHSDTSPRTLIAQGVEIEDQQLRLATDAAKLGPHSTEIQQTHIIERRNRLHRRIAAWRLVQQLYIPTVTPFILNDGHASDIDPECLHLYLPSAMMPSDDAEALLPPELLRLAEYEWRLRYAQGLDHLAELRRLLLLRSTMYQSKDRYSRGQYHSTRSATLLANVQARVNETRDRYRACYNALVKLNDNDVRSLRQGQDLSSLESEGSRQAEGFRTLSWIWSAQRPSNGSGDATANMNEALRIEWCKTRARAHRWQEECLLLHEEMRRVVQFHEYQTNIWTSRAEVVETEGKRAYALRQASIQRGLADKCRKSWSVANSRMLNPEPFVEAPMTSSIVG